jgi:hypothetical protein
MYGCSGLCGVGNIPWGYLGQDDSGIEGPTLEQAGLTVNDLLQYANSGTTSDPSTLQTIAQIFQSAAPAVNSILQQVQFGQLASTTPLNQLPQLRAAVTGAPVSASSIISSTLSNPTVLLLGAGLLVFMTMRRGK